MKMVSKRKPARLDPASVSLDSPSKAAEDGWIADPQVERAFRAARAARENAHAPYSKFPVGAALKLKGVDELFVGCNVENVTLCGGICAERVAVTQAVALHGKIEPEFLLIVTAEEQTTVPCGICRQFLVEFCADDFPIYSANLKSVCNRHTLGALLPQAYRKFESVG